MSGKNVSQSDTVKVTRCSAWALADFSARQFFAEAKSKSRERVIP